MTMRDIKFRAWHKDNDSMVYFDNKKASKDMYIAMNLCALMNGDFGDVLMQYTGLKDKNGNGLIEVWEGDIISKDGELIGNIHENNKRETDIVIPQLGTKDWESAYKEAVDRGFDYSE